MEDMPRVLWAHNTCLILAFQWKLYPLPGKAARSLDRTAHAVLDTDQELTMETTVLLVDDHPLFRKGLRLPMEEGSPKPLALVSAPARTPCLRRSLDQARQS